MSTILIILSFVVAYVVFSQILKGNVAIAPCFIILLAIDYHMWLRGGGGYFFYDKTQIEKDLREIQKLEIQKKLEELKK